jgi:hypothetical protein
MNPFGSYRALLANAMSALAAAVEIYNKPRIPYRDECTVILLVNAWELLLKAILSRKRVRIYYRKRRNQPYRTYSLSFLPGGGRLRRGGEKHRVTRRVSRQRHTFLQCTRLRRDHLRPCPNRYH